MNKRTLLKSLLSILLLNSILNIKNIIAKEKMTKTDAEWQKILSDSEYAVLRKEGTERAFTNNLNDEKRMQLLLQRL
jgi:hypothetical protein